MSNQIDCRVVWFCLVHFKGTARSEVEGKEGFIRCNQRKKKKKILV